MKLKLGYTGFTLSVGLSISVWNHVHSVSLQNNKIWIFDISLFVRLIMSCFDLKWQDSNMNDSMGNHRVAGGLHRMQVF